MTTIVLEDGKYTIEAENGIYHALRNGERWRELTGDKLFGALVNRTEELQADLDRLKKQEPVGELVLFANDPDLKEVSWKAGRMPSAGSKLYLAAGAQPDTKELAELRADAEPCPECFSHDCNGECSGDGAMGD